MNDSVLVGVTKFLVMFFRKNPKKYYLTLTLIGILSILIGGYKITNGAEDEDNFRLFIGIIYTILAIIMTIGWYIEYRKHKNLAQGGKKQETRDK